MQRISSRKSILDLVLTLALLVFSGKSFSAELMVSIASDRASPVMLDGNLVSGDVYIFVSNASAVKQVLFYLDDPEMVHAPIQAEYIESYDFAGTDQASGSAYPYDTTQLVIGRHLILAHIEYTDGGYEVARAEFSYDPPNIPLALTSNAVLKVSSLENRSSASILDGATLANEAYIFLDHASGIRRVEFYLDNPTMDQLPIQTEYLQAYDFNGTDQGTGTARPFDLSLQTNGPHVVSARIEFVDGSYRILEAQYHKSDKLTSVPVSDPKPTVSPQPTLSPGPVSNTAKKWHPGHYLHAYWGKNMAWSMSRVKDNPNLKGIGVIHQWRELEPSKGAYDFSKIESELAQAKAANKQLMIQINDRTFWKNWPDCVPDYLKSDPVYKGGQSKFGVKCTALRWIPEVQDRLIALYTALGKRFNAEPNFEAIYLEEDGVELSGTNMSQYTARAYTEQERRGMAALAAAFQNTQVFKFLAWGPNVGELFNYAHELGIGVGGSDLVPDQKTFSTQYYTQFSGKMPLQISSQDPRVKQYIDEGGSVPRMFDFAIDDVSGLHVNYIMWDQPEYANLSYTRDILPIINRTQGKINTGCPSNIRCR